MLRNYLNTGQRRCYDTAGAEIPCAGSGQDAEHAPGEPWPAPRFATEGEWVRDRLTGLCWARDARLTEFPITWSEALDWVAELNARGHAGRRDWRLPNRRELRSLVSFQARNPALPEGHPFDRVHLAWYWTSTTAAINPSYAWYVHLEGGRMFYGEKNEYHLVWPCAGPGSPVLPATGQLRCFDAAGQPIPGDGSGQDGELRLGVPWPTPRFVVEGEPVRDALTGLRWLRQADLTGRDVTCDEAYAAVRELATQRRGWRLPTINELESLVDASRHSPALPGDHPFDAVAEAYWSSTSSAFEPDWSMALYLTKGAVGVGQKKGAHFRVWPVREALRDST